MTEPFRLFPGWRAGDGDEILAALRTLYCYSEREPDRATGWLYSARQIGALPVKPWPQPIMDLGDSLINDLEDATGIWFEAACFQAYLDGSGCGWHYDRDWDAQAILSLGVTRTFGIRPAADAAFVPGAEVGETVLTLAHGDLLFMPPGFQDSWEHCVPVEDVTGERCSIVFRAAAQDG